MKSLQTLSNFFLFFLLVSANSFAGTKWEVATVFLGAQEDEYFQADVDQNIMELSRLEPSKELVVSLYREAPSNTFTYFPGTTSPARLTLGDLLVDKKNGSFPIPGKLSAASRAKLLAHLKTSFKDKKAKKILLFYGHGLGPAGMRDMQLLELKKLLTDLKIKLDILWFDACFMGNIELLYELRHVAHYSVSSQEAEFTSGLTFQSLDELPSLTSAKEAATMLARRFIESYSFLKKGRQTNAVSSSSATIAVIDNSRLEAFVEDLKVIQELDKVTPEERITLRNRLSKHFGMDDKSLVDLGNLLVEYRKINSIKDIDTRLTKLIRLMNISSVKALRSNPRIRIFWPKANAQMVYGFNEWKNGHEVDYKENDVYPRILKSDKFLIGSGQKNWPTITTKGKSIIVTPFGPGINTFNYYFIDPKTGLKIGETSSVTRSADQVETTGELLVYQAYTQQLGKKAEKYSGLTISNIDTVPSIDYYEMEFNRILNWLKF